MFHNHTGGSLTANIKGSSATAKQVDGVCTVSLSAGVDVTVAAWEHKILNVNSRKEFMTGTTVTVTGAAGLTAAVLQC